MSALLNNLSPWIASNLSRTLTFDPTSKPKIDRKPKIVQIVETPQDIPKISAPTSDEFPVPKLESWVYLIVKDKLHSIPLVLPPSISNVSVCRSKRPDLFQAKGGILTLSNWHVSHVNLLRIPKMNGNILVLVIEDEEETQQQVESYSQELPSMSLQGGEGMNVLPHENVHRSIMLRRALQTVSDARIQWRQVLDCYNYTRGRPGKHDNKLIPSYQGSLGNPNRQCPEIISKAIKKCEEEKDWDGCSDNSEEEEIAQKRSTRDNNQKETAGRDLERHTDQFITSSPYSQETEGENVAGISAMLFSQTQDSIGEDDEYDMVEPCVSSGQDSKKESIQTREHSRHPENAEIERKQAMIPDTLKDFVPGTQLEDEHIPQESKEYVPGTQLQDEIIPRKYETLNEVHFIGKEFDCSNFDKSEEVIVRESAEQCTPSNANTVFETTREIDEKESSIDDMNLTKAQAQGSNNDDRTIHETLRITESKRKYESIADKIKKIRLRKA